MKKKNLIKHTIILLILMVPSIVNAKILQPFSINLSPISNVPKGGNFQVELKITPRFECEEIQVSIQTFGDISISHEKSWKDKMNGKDSLEYLLSLTIPDQDTTGFEVKVQSGKIWHHAFLYFVTTGEEIEVYKGNPRFKLKHPPTEMIISIDGDKDEKLPSELPGYKQGILGKEVKILYDHSNNESNIYEPDDSKKITKIKKNESDKNNHSNHTNVTEIIPNTYDNNTKYDNEKPTNKKTKYSDSIHSYLNLKNQNRSSTERATIFYENFNGSYPGPWYIGHDGGGGSYAWAWPNDYAHCYSNPSGGQYYYPNDLHVYMERRNVSLSGYSTALLSFYKVVDTESGWDEFTVNVRDQSQNWYTIYVESGITDPLNWEYLELDLDAFAGQTGLYIQFRFDSDGSVCGDPYEGVYIDNVELTAEISCNPDPYEPNNTSAQATSMDLEFSIYAYICPQGDEDWFKVPISGIGTYTIDLTSLPDDYDLKFYDPNLNLLDSSINSGTNSEQIEYSNFTKSGY